MDTCNIWPVVLSLVLISSGGCSDQRPEPPLDDSTMVEVMIELHLALARTEVTHRVPAGIRDSIFAAYEIDSSAFAETISYYAAEPDEYGRLYGRVLDRLNSERMPLGPADSADDPDLPAGAMREDSRPGTIR